MKPNSRETLLAEGVRTLTAARTPDPARDARVLLRWASGLEAAAFSARLDEPPGPQEAARYSAALAARAARRPVSQIMGRREFWGRDFEVSSDVLDPRPETETLIAAALEGALRDRRSEARVLDLGVGSGCILLTLLAERAECVGVGVDASAEAVEMARRNARRLGVDGRATLVQGDWFAPAPGRFDVVVSNPPYIPDAQFDALEPEVRLWEPTAALLPGGDGLGAYRTLVRGLSDALAPGGRALFEFGAGQERDVSAIFQANGFETLAIHPDADGRPRCIEAAMSR